MFKNNLKISFRNLFKYRSSSIINIIGLSIGMAVFLIIMLYVQNEKNYDTFWKQSDNIYRITYDRYQNGELKLKSARSLSGMSRVLKDQVPEIKGSTQLHRDLVTIYTNEQQIIDIDMFATDSTFFDVFDLDFIDKKTENPLKDLYGSVISESAAKRLFGTEKALGKWFKVCQGWEFEVTGVFRDLPQNTHMPFDLLLTFPTYHYYFANWNDSLGRVVVQNPNAHIRNNEITQWTWGYNGTYSFIKTEPKANAEQLLSKVHELSEQYTREIQKNDGKAQFHLQPIRDIHLTSHLDYEIKPNGDEKSVWAFSIIALVILAIAWINFINLTLAHSLERIKETVVRKVLGASRLQLILQYFLQYTIINLISINLALNVVLIFEPFFYRKIGANISLTSLGDPNVWIALLLIFVIGSLISGLYPAYVQSSFNTTHFLKKQSRSHAGKVNLRKILVTVQFAASIILIIGVFTVYKQISHMKSQDLGVNIEQTLVTYSPMTMIGKPDRIRKIENYKMRIMNISGVESVTTSSVIPGRKFLWISQDIRSDGSLPNSTNSYAYAYIDHDYLSAFDLTLLAGRNFTNNNGAEQNCVIINEAAAKQLGLDDYSKAVNSFILNKDVQLKVIGVIRDYHHESLKAEIKPLICFYGYQWLNDVGYYSVKIKSTDLETTIKEINNIWSQTYPKDQFNYFFLDEEFNYQYKSDQQFSKVFAFFTLLGIVIACMGLQALVAFSTVQRTKEIGIRKVNGASAGSIVILLSREFAYMVIIGYLIACPVAYFIMDNWLQNYAYRTKLSWWIFVLAGLFAFTIALITICSKTYRTANKNPVDALRYE